MKTKSYTAVLSESERVMSADWAEVVCHSVKAAIGVIAGLQAAVELELPGK